MPSNASYFSHEERVGAIVPRECWARGMMTRGMGGDVNSSLLLVVSVTLVERELDEPEVDEA